MRLRQFNRRNTQLLLHCPPELAATDTEVARQPFQSMFVECTGRDARRCGFSEPRHSVYSCAAWRELRSAAQAWAETRAFRCGGAAEIPPVFPQRAACRADGSAVDRRGRDAHEEHAVEPGIG